MLKLFATCPKGLELLLVEELRTLGVTDPREKLAGVTFTGDIATAYRVCLWSRLANRVLLHLVDFPSASPEALYAGIRTIDWDQHINVSGTLNVNFVCAQSQINHTLFGAQKVKDAIVDQLRDKYGVRPNVAAENADVNVYVLLKKDVASVSIDLAGESLHKRGYRLSQGEAPLKENLAAAILLRSGWREIARNGGTLLDPMCGSGTLLIEGALMAANIAPGFYRHYFGFKGWKQHDPMIWKQLFEEAKQQIRANIPRIIGYDIDSDAVKIAQDNIQRAGMSGKIHIEKKDLASCKQLARMQTGLIVVNPPYGERIGDENELPRLYAGLGHQFKTEFSGWEAGVFTGNPSLGKKMGLRSYRHYKLFNGIIACELLLFHIQPEYFIDSSPAAENERRIRRAQKVLKEAGTDAIEMFINRIRKNDKHLSRIAQKTNVQDYRLYDADIPEFAVAIDRKEGSVIVQEYPPAGKNDSKMADTRLQLILAVLPDILAVPPANVFVHYYPRPCYNSASIKQGKKSASYGKPNRERSSKDKR